PLAPVNGPLGVHPRSHHDPHGWSRAAAAASRREFLQQAAGLAAGAAALAPSPAPAQPPAGGQSLPTVRLGRHDVTRLILGGNPIYGHSHFNRLFSQHMTASPTPHPLPHLL